MVGELIEVWRLIHSGHCARSWTTGRYGQGDIVCAGRLCLLQGDDIFVRTDLVPRQADDQGVELFAAQFNLFRLPDFG